MTDYLRELRLLPIAVVASACLLVLVAADLLLDRAAPADSGNFADAGVVHATSGVARPSDPKQSWAQQMFNFPDAKATKPAPIDLAFFPPPMPDKNNADVLVTGSVPEPDKSEGKGKGDKPTAGKEGQPPPATKDSPAAAPPPPDGKVIANPGVPGPSGAERAILKRLSERRQELEKRARELDIREGLIGEAEKRVDARLADIKEAKAQLAAAEDQKDQAEAARFKNLVTMYETMKPRDAAKIFDRLEVSVLIEVASQINPRVMSEILAQMSPDTAQRLTVELASRAKAATKDPAADLPKIEGRPTAQ